MGTLTGRVIKGYELVEQIGTGSFGEVYRAYQPAVGREVAIKIILPHYANHPEFIRRFEAEAQLVARVEHPFIVPLYDYWREPDGAYLVMRYLRGGSLKDMIHQTGGLPLEYVMRVLDQVCSALATAHNGGIVHRDMKPANLLLDDQQNVYLADFGIAKDLDVSAEATVAGSVVGSPAYLSPEQVQADAVSPASDVYGLGVVLYEMLVGEKPFPNETVSSLLIKQVNDPLPNVRLKRPELTREINDVVQRATAKRPKNRFSNALMMAAAFRKALLAADIEISSSYVLDGQRIPTTGHGAEDRTTTATFDPLTDHTQEVGSSLDFDLPEPENPYKGLRAFQESDSSDFFGRASLVDTLLDRMQQEHALARFLAVVGPSGSGKSSVVKAGLIPALRRDAIPGSNRWYMVEMVPGAYPFEELEAALLRIAINPPASLLTQLQESDDGLRRAIKRVLPDDPQTELFLLIDQFEEIFTLVEDESVRTRFLASLIEAVNDPHSRLRVVITIRADFYDRPLFYATFGQAIRERTEVVLPLNHDELSAAINEPANRVGLRVEPMLAQEIISDVQAQPGALPLLQYALTELYERREERVLTLQAYQDIGGISGALARRAEELYLNMSSAEQDVTRQIFMRLVALGEGTEDTRRRVFRRDLLAIQQDNDTINRVLDTFGKYRLLTFDHDPSSREPTVEVAHEALIRQWVRLKDWINDRRDDLRQYARLSNATRDWESAKRDSSFLATGTRLSQLEEWQVNSALTLTASEADYIQTSIARREAEAHAEAERAAREKALEVRSRRFLRSLVATLAIGLLVAIGLTLFAFSARNDAEENADIAEANAQTAREQSDLAQTLALVANARNAANEYDPNLALALAIEASDILNPTLPEVERTLSSTAFGPAVRYRMEEQGGTILSLAISDDGEWAVSASADGTAVLWNIESGEVARTFEGHSGAVLAVDISPDGTLLATGSADDTAIIWNLESGEVVQTLTGHGDDVNAVAFSPDGSQVATTSGNFSRESDDTSLRIWDVASGENLQTLPHVGAVLDLAYRPDGTQIATVSGSSSGVVGSDRRQGQLWDIESGEVVAEYIGITGLPRSIDFSPSGDRVVIGTWDSSNSGTVRIYDAQSGEELRRLFGHPNIITRVAFTPNGEGVISASWDNSMRVWDLNTGVEVARYETHNDRVLALAIAPDGSLAISGTGNLGEDQQTDIFQDKGVYVWDLQPRAQLLIAEGHTDWLWASVFAPDGATFATGAGSLFEPEMDNTVRIWDTASGELLQTLEGHTHTVDTLAYFADGTRLLSAGWDNIAILWDLTTGEEIRRYEGHSDYIETLALSPDEQTFLTASHDGTVILWDVESGDLLQQFTITDDGEDVNAVAWASDGKSFFTGIESGTIQEWATASGDAVRTLGRHNNAITALAVSPDGAILASSSQDGTAETWDIASGRALNQFLGHSNWVNDVRFSPDGQMLITAGADTTVRIWDVASGEEIRRFEGHTDWVVSADISFDGHRVVSGSDDKTARVWFLARNVSELREWAVANRYIPDLTCQQRQNYNLDTTGCP